VELFFDLAWTTTFAGLTENSPITGPSTVGSYAVFFVLAWWLWISQVLYDTKYYANDWFHRLMLLLQFCIFFALAAFTEGFDVTNGFTADDSVDTDPAEFVDDAYLKRGFLAIALIFTISRLLLAIEYLRVARYGHHRRIAHLFLTSGSLLISAILFFVSFFVLRANPNTQSANIAKFVLWGLALLIEVSTYLYARMPAGLLRQGSMPERLATLTTVVLGEGLNSMVETLVSTAKAVGFNAATAAQIFVVAVVIFILFILYFDSFRVRTAPTAFRQKLVILWHFPTQMFIILLVAGMKSTLNLTTVLNSITFFEGELSANITDDQLSSDFAAIGINFTADAINLGNISRNDNETILRIFADSFLAIFNEYKVLNAETQKEWNSYINTPGGLAYNDSLTFPDDFPALEDLVDNALAPELAPVMWITGIAGAYLVALAILALLVGVPKNKYSALSIFTRFFFGTALMLLSLVDINSDFLQNWILSGWFLPTIVIVYVLQFFIDYVISVLLARNIHFRNRHEEHFAKQIQTPSPSP